MSSSSLSLRRRCCSGEPWTATWRAWRSRPTCRPTLRSDIAIGDISFLDPEVRRGRAEASRRLFETFMAGQGVPRSDTGSSGLCFGWRRGELEEDDFVGHYGRAFDITVLGRPSDQANHPRPPTVEAALFESGRPVLIVPPAPPGHAWHDSCDCLEPEHGDGPHRCSGHAAFGQGAADCRDRLRGLGRVRPVDAGSQPHSQAKRPAGGDPDGPEPAWARGRGYSGGGDVTGCDLLVKGAYTQSRLRQFIFGGATSHILSHTTVPVLMAH